MIDDRLLTFLGALLLVAFATFALHDRHYRRRRDVVREARIAALESLVPEEHKHKLLEARINAVEGILLEDETT